MKKIVPLVVILFLLCFLCSCYISSGVPQEQYDEICKQIQEYENQNVILNNQINELKQKYELVGDTTIETVTNIVEQYHETHIYLECDFFVCADMALDVWDMCKAQGINAIIKVGNVETEVEEFKDTNHAWVVAEVNSGEYLALETTGGYVVFSDENPLYYRGWSFDNPKEYKRWVELMQELVIRLNLIEQSLKDWNITRQKGLDAKNEALALADEVETLSIYDPSWSSKVLELFEKMGKCGELIGRMNQIDELSRQQMDEIDNIITEMKDLVN